MAASWIVPVLWLGQTLSLMADDVEQFALKTQVHALGHNLTDLTWFVVAVELPSLLLSPFIGAFVDRLPKYMTIIVADTLSVASTIVLALELNTFGFLSPSTDSILQPSSPRWSVIYASCAINSLANVLQWPAFQVLMRSLVNSHRVSLYTQSAPALSMLLAPLISSYILHWFGLPAVFGLSVVTWAVAVSVTVSCFATLGPVHLHHPSPTPSQVWGDAMEVITTVANSTAMRASAVLMVRPTT
jgi:MFS family permease